MDQQTGFWNIWVRNSNSVTWEEKAFAEDAARRSGGFVWPPRSYNCNFCGREFKSAQGLGGHMNVHRRDRARLKQSPVKSQNHNNYLQNPTAEPEVLECPNQVRSMVYNTNIVNHNSGKLPPPFTQKSTYDQSFVLFSTSQVQQKRPYYSFLPSRSDFTSDIRLFSIIDSTTEEDVTKKQKSRPFEADIDKNDCLTTVSMEETTGCEGRRTDDLSLPFFLKAATKDNLDLELRLGNRP